VTIALVTFAATLMAGLIVANLMSPPASSPGSTSRSSPAPVSLDMTGYDPNHLIDDEVFYNSQAMTSAEVARFISTVNDGCVPGIDGTPCLAASTFDTEDKEATSTCEAYRGAKGETAAAIVSKVSTACGVNPQVLLVLIQKEQGLLTASGRTLTARAYEAAAGYACPDGATCNAQWGGFFHQIYAAASQFQLYRLNPWEYGVVQGVTTQVAYSADPDCGAADLTAATQSTAGLYDYTPYQSNQAAASGGDSCTSWGNWNFYGYFRTFFGDPTPSTPEAGS